MKLINNEAIDFICAVKRFADRKNPKDPDKQGLMQVESWCREYEEKLSPFLLNDLSLLVEKMIAPTLFMWYLNFKTEVFNSVEELLSTLEMMPLDEFIKGIEKVLGLKPEDVTDVETLQNIIEDEGLFPYHDPKLEAELLLGFLKDPQDLQKRLHRCYSDFYEQAYKPGKEALQQVIEEKQLWHQNRLDNNSDEYILNLGMENFIKEILEMGEPILYFSLFADSEIIAILYHRVLIIGGGTDNQIRSQSAKDKSSLFLSCMGDPKRLEILRLTAIRPWYGTELAKYFDLKPATLSYHINKLVDANLLNLTKGEQRRFYYSLNKEAVGKFLEFVKQDLIGLES